MTRVRSLVVAALLSVTAPVNANLISNGSFELPIVPVGSFTDFIPGTMFGAWRTVGTGNVAIVNTTFNQFGISFAAQEGNQWLDLTGNGSNGANGVEQTIATSPGSTYAITYYIGNAIGGIFGNSSGLSISLNGVVGLTGRVTSSVPSNILNWSRFEQRFIASNASTTLRFINTDGPSDNSNGLDNISIVEVAGPPTSVVPVPAALPLLATGLAVLGLLGRRRARRR